MVNLSQNIKTHKYTMYNYNKTSCFINSTMLTVNLSPVNTFLVNLTITVSLVQLCSCLNTLNNSSQKTTKHTNIIIHANIIIH